MLELHTLSSLAKVYIDRPLDMQHKISEATMLQNDKYHFQVAFKNSEDKYKPIPLIDFSVTSDLGEALSVRFVENVACDYISREPDLDLCEHPEPGLLPDILETKIPELIWSYSNIWRSFWLTVDTKDHTVAPGKYEIKISMTDKDEDKTETSFTIEVLSAKMPKQPIPVTNWLHCDAVCQYYNVEFASDEFWRIIKNNIKTSVDNNSNMILTPVFTPPLDTQIGGERLTTQLVDVTVENGKYTFGFEKLEKWLEICKECEVEYIEISHLFTQWGCKFAPKVMATVDGEYKKLFGWETDGHGDEYLGFMGEFLTELVAVLKKHNVYDNTYFHISDEPSLKVLEDYKQGIDFVSKYIPKTKIIDALSSFEFYKEGVLETPIPSLDHLQPFYDAGVENLWGYYCGSQSRTSNRYIGMASNINRMVGTVLFKYDLKGFLHWGWNFYNTCKSLYPVNPYRTSTGLGWVPAGDTYLVYPGEKGEVIESIRLCVFSDAIKDCTLLSFLAQKIGKDEVVKKFGLEDIDCFAFLSPKKIIENRELLNKMINEL